MTDDERSEHSEIASGMGGRHKIKHVIVAGGRLALENDGLTRVALPIHYMISTLGHTDQARLWRWADAKQLLLGNMAVVIADGEPRGRYREAAQKGVTLQAYVKRECEAYQWILRNSEPRIRNQAEIFARMMAEIVDVDFIGWGKFVANTDDTLIALGASIGTTSDLAWYLEEKYSAYAEFCKQRDQRNREVMTALREHRVIAGKR